MDDEGLIDEHADRYGFFHGSREIALADDPQTILAAGMDGVPCADRAGSPMQLRAEIQLGFTMVKCLRGIEGQTSRARSSATWRPMTPTSRRAAAAWKATSCRISGIGFPPI
jgi:DMSO/TMAO reductase YedYZ molybdopterin-dependent catalytic subunit